MLHSEILKERIGEAEDVLYTIETPGWRKFIKDIVHPLEFDAFEKWKTVPAENSAEVVWLQRGAMIADLINGWPDRIRTGLEKDTEALRAIHDGEEEDDDLEKEKEASWLDKFWAWRAKKDMEDNGDLKDQL